MNFVEIVALIIAVIQILWLLIVIWLWKVYLPSLITEGGTKVEAAIEEKLPEMVKKSAPYIKDAFKDEIPDFEKDIIPKLKDALKNELPNFDDMIKKIKEEIKKEIPKIPTMEEATEDVMSYILKKLADKEDEEVNAIFTIITARAVGGFMYMAKHDEKFKEWMGGMVNGIRSSVIKGVKEEFGPLAESFGVDIDNPESGGLDDMDMEKMGKKAFMGFLKKKGWL